MVAVGGIDELGGHPQPVACFAHATFKNCMYLQLASDLADVFILSLKRKRRRARGHSKRFDFCQRIDDLFCNSTAEVFVLWIVAHVNESEDGDALLWYFGNSSG